MLCVHVDTMSRNTSTSDAAMLPDIQTEADPEDASLGSSPQLYKAVYDFAVQREGDLSFSEGDIIKVTNKEGEWWTGEHDGRSGTFPCTYVTRILADPSPTQLHRHLDIPDDILTPGSQRKKRLIGRVIAGFTAERPGQLTVTPGDLILVKRQDPKGWWEGEVQSKGKKRKVGWFPANRIELLTPGITKVPSSPASVSWSTHHMLSWHIPVH